MMRSPLVMLMLVVAPLLVIQTRVAIAQQYVVVVLDDSGSMDERMRSAGRVRRIDAAKQALKGVLSNLPAETNVGVLALNSTVNSSPWIVPLGPLGQANWQQNINSLQANGGTPLGESLKTAADALLAARENQMYGSFRLLVVTDGEANDPQLVDQYLPQIMARTLTVDVIGVDMTADHSLATRAHSYRRADDNRSLTQAISEVFAETSMDDQGDNSDFELLEGLPDEVALGAIEALTTLNNEPILDADEGDGSLGFGQSSSTVVKSTAFDLILGLGCFCMVGFLFIGGLIIVLAKAGKRR